MKNKAKRIVSAICALAMCAAMLPAAAFAEGDTVPETTTTTSAKSTSDVTEMEIGDTITFHGQDSQKTHSWKITGDVDSFEIVGSDNGQEVTVKALAAGEATVSHYYYTTPSMPIPSIEFFTVKVVQTATAGDLSVSVSLDVMPSAEPVAIPLELEYYGDQIISMVDPDFESLEFTATFTEAGTVTAVPTTPDAELPEGFYRMRYAAGGDFAGTSVVYIEVMDTGTYRFVSRSETPITNPDNIAKYSTVTLEYRGEIVEPAPTPVAPTADNVMALIGDSGIQLSCSDVPGSHTMTTSLLGDENTDYKIDYTDGEIKARVTILSTEQYVTAFNEKTGATHSANTEASDLTIDLVYENDVWTLAGEAPVASIVMTCGMGAPDTDVDPPETDPITPNPDEEDGVTVDKTATGLVDDKSNVTLTVGGGEETTASDVVFVLDKSASSDIRQEAMDMLTELQKQAGEGNIINVGVVNFEKGVLEQLELTALNDENYAAIEKAMIFQDVASSGTNIYAGLVAGEAMLDADTTVDDANKHLVLVTDGVGYLWGDGSENNVFSIYSESTSNGEENLYASHETIDWHHSSTSYYDEFQDMLKWYNDNSASIAADMNTYQMVYEEGQYTATAYNVPHGQGQNTDWSLVPKFNKENSYVPAELENETASAPDAAIYMVAREWIKIAEKYNAYAYADPRYAKSGDYLWAYNAISNLGDLGDASYTLPENAADYDGMFDAVKSTVLYDIESGTVTDVIGSNFDVASLDSFVLTVGGIEMKGVVNGNTINFGEAVDGVYPYVVTYTTGENEQFTWAINVPVEDGAAVRLTYTVKLVNKASTPGDYTVPTNEEATLDYNSTTGEQGTETFPVPEVTYNVPETTTVTATATPAPDEHPDIAEGIANGTWGGAPTATPAQTMSVPQTSDDLPLGALILVAVVAAGAVCGLVVLRKRGEQ